MTHNILKCVEVNRLKNINLLTNAIYNNFLYLKDFPELMHDEENIKKILETDGNLCYLVYNNNNLISYLIGDFRTLEDNRYVYYISYLYVSKKYRNKKIGSKLMKNIMNKCNSVGAKFIVLTCDTNDNKIVNFYKKYGFVKDPVLGNTNKRHNVFSLFL